MSDKKTCKTYKYGNLVPLMFEEAVKADGSPFAEVDGRRYLRWNMVRLVQDGENLAVEFWLDSKLVMTNYTEIPDFGTGVEWRLEDVFGMSPVTLL